MSRSQNALTDADVEAGDSVVAAAESYYDSKDADNFYFNIWGGEDIHIGIYDETNDIAEASRRTVVEMAKVVAPITSDTRVLDIGAGYGGAARQLASAFNCHVTCLNLSETQNATNRRLTTAAGLEHLIDVQHGNFETIPAADESFDLVWSQDAILHSARRDHVLKEVFRVLKPGGRFVFTDPMQADDCPADVLQPVYDRIHLESLGSFAFYHQTARQLGFQDLGTADRTAQLLHHYTRVREELKSNYGQIIEVSSKDYVDTMINGLGHWIAAAQQGHLAWGIMCFGKTADIG
jgi:ubiquinone/menaquinone biosynthesis C-methylase UbiE